MLHAQPDSESASMDGPAIPRAGRPQRRRRRRILFSLLAMFLALILFEDRDLA